MNQFRKSPRLKGFDYSNDGSFYITINVQQGLHLFGHVENGEMMLNDAGKMINRWYREIESKFPDWHCDASIVMPNHFHCILRKGLSKFTLLDISMFSTGGPMCPPDSIPIHPSTTHLRTGGPMCPPGFTESNPIKCLNSSLTTVMQWFKTMTTNEYIRHVKASGWGPFHGKLWHRSFYDSIVKSDHEYTAILLYIINNPSNWENDQLW